MLLSGSCLYVYIWYFCWAVSLWWHVIYSYVFIDDNTYIFMLYINFSLALPNSRVRRCWVAVFWRLSLSHELYSCCLQPSPSVPCPPVLVARPSIYIDTRMLRAALQLSSSTPTSSTATTCRATQPSTCQLCAILLYVLCVYLALVNCVLYFMFVCVCTLQHLSTVCCYYLIMIILMVFVWPGDSSKF